MNLEEYCKTFKNRSRSDTLDRFFVIFTKALSNALITFILIKSVDARSLSLLF